MYTRFHVMHRQINAFCMIALDEPLSKKKKKNKTIILLAAHTAPQVELPTVQQPATVL